MATVKALVLLVPLSIAMFSHAWAGVPPVLNGIVEAQLQSTREYGNPSADVQVQVHFTSPSGKRASIRAFWDGGDSWKARFSPTETGKWTWKSQCSDTADKGLHGRAGTFDCTPYKGKNPLQTHGPLKLSSNRRYLVYADGKPFFWLADTAWNGVLKARPQDWEQYLSLRKSQGFTSIQFISTPWRCFDKDSHGETAFTGRENIRINPQFFQRLDAKVAAINEHGMVASPVILWAVGRDDPGQALSEKDAIRLANYIVARWGAYNVVWMLGGDGDYRGDRADRWRRIGRKVFDGMFRLATMHPGGLKWVGDEFRLEPWYSFIGYQSGHGDTEDGIRWLVEGPPAREWNEEPVLPVINLEPNYEEIRSYKSRRVFDAYDVRTALYRSLFNAPTAGVTYGHHGIWFWTDKPQVPTAHPRSGIAQPWDQAMRAEGGRSVKYLSTVFSYLQWWKLRPDPKLVVNAPSDPRKFIASAKSEDGTLALIYLPQGGEVEIDTSKLKRPANARWFDPANGRFRPIGKVTQDRLKLQAPGPNDWLLIIKTD